MFSKLLLFWVILFIVTVSAVNAETAEKELSCGSITVKIGDKTFNGFIVPENSTDGKVILRPRFNGYEELNAWIGYVDPTKPATHDLIKAAEKYCK